MVLHLCCAIGLIKLAPFFHPIRSKTRSHAFSRASPQKHASAANFDWFTGLSVFFEEGQSDYFGFGFKTLN